MKRLAAWNAPAPLDVELPFMPARVILQDFTGVPAVVDLASMRGGGEAPGRRPAADQPAGAGGPGGRPLGAGGRLRLAGRARRRTPRSSSSATASATSSCAGGRRRSHNFRVVPPATGIVHQVNLEYLAKGVLTQERGRRDGRLPRHARRHRLAHHDDQRPRRAGLGRGRHRGRGGDARPAALHGHAAGGGLQAHRAGCARASPPPTSCSPSPRCCARRAWSRSSSSSTAPASAQMTPGRPRHDRQHGARVRRHLRLLPGRRRDARATCAAPAAARPRWTLVERYCKEQGLFRTDGDARPRLQRHARARPRRRSSRASPGRSGRRTACRSRR